jgi:DNA-binding transcriptional regulator YiaG
MTTTSATNAGLDTGIQSIRKRLGITQRQFADRLLVRPATVSRWEAGVFKPGAAILVQLFRLAQREEEIKPIATALTAMGVPLEALDSLSEPAAAA